MVSCKLDPAQTDYICLVVSEDADQEQFRLWSRDFETELIIKQKNDETQRHKVGDWIDFSMERGTDRVIAYSRRQEPVLKTRFDEKKKRLMVKTKLIFCQPDETNVAESPKLGRVGNFTQFEAEQLICYEAWVARLDSSKPKHAVKMADFNVKWAILKGKIVEISGFPASKGPIANDMLTQATEPEKISYRAVVVTTSDRNNAFGWIMETRENVFIQDGALQGLKPGDWIEFPKDWLRPFHGYRKDSPLQVLSTWKRIDDVLITESYRNSKTIKIQITAKFKPPILANLRFLFDERFGRIKVDPKIRTDFYGREMRFWLLKLKPEFDGDAEWVLIERLEPETSKDRPMKLRPINNKTTVQNPLYQLFDQCREDGFVVEPVIAVIVFVESIEKFAWNPSVGTVHLPGQLASGYEMGDWIHCTLKKGSNAGTGSAAKCRLSAVRCEKMREAPLSTTLSGGTILVRVNVYIPTGLPYEPEILIKSIDLNAVRFRRTDLPLSVEGTSWNIWAHFNKKMAFSSTPWTFTRFDYCDLTERINMQEIDQLSHNGDDPGYHRDRDRYASGTSHGTTVFSGIGDTIAIAPRQALQSYHHQTPAIVSVKPGLNRPHFQSISQPGRSLDDCLKRLLENRCVVAVLKATDLQLFADLCERAAKISC